MADWTRPQEIDDITLAFPADVERLMPDYDSIPNEFKQLSGNEWVYFQSRWFYEGLPETTEIGLKDGIDGAKAIRHLKAIQGSFEPKHEHKMAAVAYLASLWFHAIDYGE